MENKRSKIIDCTLREGNQNPGVQFSVDESVRIAKRLYEFGVDAIEVGHPVANNLEFERVKAVCELGLPIPVLSHARARRADIDAVSEAGASWVGIFIAVNEISLNAKYSGRSLEEIKSIMCDAIAYAKSLNLKVRMTIEDSTRTPLPLLLDAFQVAKEAGADRLCISDTVGLIEYDELIELIFAVRNFVGESEIEVHFHDDRGLAMANSLAVCDKVEWISTSVNGLGERCGITDTIGLYENLNFKYKLARSNLKVGRLLSELVRVVTSTDVESRRPIVGKNAFLHSSPLHAKAVAKNPFSYLWCNEYSDILEQSVDLIKERKSNIELINFRPPIKPASELRFHRDGIGDRFVMHDATTFLGAQEYCIARKIPYVDAAPDAHVDAHVHNCMSMFLFFGDEKHYRGLTVEVQLDDEFFVVKSPASVFIPPGKLHSYRILKGAGTYINLVMAGDYNSSLFDELRG